MRTRLVLLVVAILLIAGFAALNWSEVVRPAPLLFGPVVIDAPLGAILLGLLAVTIVLFAVSAGALRTHHLMESRRYAKELDAQRLLADKAEASRYADLRRSLDEHLQRMGERDMTLASEWQREMRAQTDASNRTIVARLNELEHRLEARFERMGWGRGPAVPPVRNDVVAGAPLRDQQAAEDARAAQMRDDEQLREERLRTENLRHETAREEREIRREERAEASDRPAGWRKWF